MWASRQERIPIDRTLTNTANGLVNAQSRLRFRSAETGDSRLQHSYQHVQEQHSRRQATEYNSNCSSEIPKLSLCN